MRQDRPVVFVRCYPEAQKGGASAKNLGSPVDISDRLVSFRYEDEERRADRCDITLDNHDMSQFDNPAWKKGGILMVSWGYPGNMTPYRRVVIQKSRGGRELKIEGHGLEMLMHKEKKTRAWRGKTLHQIVSDVVRGYQGEIFDDPNELTKGISDEAKKLKLPSVNQAAETDAMLLARLARKYGYSFFLGETGFVFRVRDAGLTDKPVKLVKWFSGDGEWLDFDYEFDATEKHSEVGSAGIDPGSKARKETRAGQGETKENAIASSLRTWTTNTGQLLQPRQVAASSPSQTTQDVLAGQTAGNLAEIGNLTKTTTSSVAKQLGNLVIDSAKALQEGLSRVEETDKQPTSTTDPVAQRAAADAKYKRRKHKDNQLSGKVIGDPSFASRTILMVEGIGRRLSGLWAVTKVDHTIDRGGYTCDFKSERQGDNGYGQGDVATKGNLNKQKADKPTEESQLPNKEWHPSKGTIAPTATFTKKPFFGGGN